MGLLYLFEISKKWPFWKGMGLGGGVAIFFGTGPELFGVLVSALIIWSGLVWFVYKVSRCLARCSNMSLVWQISVQILNDADFYAESTGEGPTLQLNDMLEKFTKNCVQAYFA